MIHHTGPPRRTEQERLVGLAWSRGGRRKVASEPVRLSLYYYPELSQQMTMEERERECRGFVAEF